MEVYLRFKEKFLLIVHSVALNLIWNNFAIMKIILLISLSYSSVMMLVINCN